MQEGNRYQKELHAMRDAIVAGRRRARSPSSPTCAASWPSLAEFYAGRSVLVTGGSGFMGRVLVEFLLRCCPGVSRIYLVLRPKKGVPCEDRLKSLVDVPLFDRVREMQPDALSKLVAVPGDVASAQLGLSQHHRELLIREVSVIFHCAASVRFDDPFKKAVFTNLRSTRDLLALAKEMPGLKVFVHVSTAYAMVNQSVIGERVYPTHMHWADVIRWAERLSDDEGCAVDLLGEKFYDFQPNTYTFTKALAERLIEDEGADLPVVITRPSIVINSLEDPIPGWIDNLNGPMALWVAGVTGILRVWLQGDTKLDTIPVDVAIKLILEASRLKGIGQRCSAEQHSEGIELVNVTIGPQVAFSFSEAKALLHSKESQLLRRMAYPNTVREPFSLTFSDSRLRVKMEVLYHHFLFGMVLDFLARLAGAKPRALKVYRKIATAAEKLNAFTTKSFVFEMKNQAYIQTLLHPADDEKLSCLAVYESRNSPQQFLDIAENTLRGILLYVLKEKEEPEKNYKAIKWIRLTTYLYHLVMLVLFSLIFYFLWSLTRIHQRPMAITL